MRKVNMYTYMLQSYQFVKKISTQNLWFVMNSDDYLISTFLNVIYRYVYITERNRCT